MLALACLRMPTLQTAFAVDPYDTRLFFIGVLDVGNLARRTAAPSFCKMTVSRIWSQAGEFGRRPQGDFIAPLFYFAGGQVQVGVLDGLDDLVQGQTGGP